MGSALLWVLLVVGLLNAALLAVLIARTSASSNSEDVLREELRASREEAARAARDSREELTAALNAANTTLSANLTAMGEMQRTQLDTVGKQVKELGDSNTASLERIRVTLDSRVKELQDGNDKKLEEMRKTVDEKLHDTLEKRLGESFKLVSERLEAVQRGLGEMQSLATGVGDLKRVLTNVKARGTWAEVQLGALLEQILTPQPVLAKREDQGGLGGARRVRHPAPRPQGRPQRGRVAAHRLEVPTRGLPAAAGRRRGGDVEAVQKATDSLARSIKIQAEAISSKYLCPPCTTDFAIMFLPTEGLYAEVLRHPALADELQHKYHVMVAGPTTLAALLSSLRHGLPDTRDRAAVRRGLEGARRGQDRVRQVRRRAREGQEAAQLGCPHYRRDRRSVAGHGAQAT